MFVCGIILEVVVKKHRQLFELILINTKKNSVIMALEENDNDY